MKRLLFVLFLSGCLMEDLPDDCNEESDSILFGKIAKAAGDLSYCEGVYNVE